jgi:hypothetical protein
MGPWLVALVGVIYVSVAIDQAVKGNIPMCIVFLGYAASNVGFWHVSDIEAAGSNVRFLASLGRQREGAQLYRRCSHRNMSTFESDEHLQALTSSQ